MYPEETVKMIRRALWFCQHCNTKTTLNYQTEPTEFRLDKVHACMMDGV